MHPPIAHSPAAAPSARPAIICFSHLRWDLVFPRPQHIMTRLSQSFDIVYWEEPRFDSAAAQPRLERTTLAQGLVRAIPVLPGGMDASAIDQTLRTLLQAEVAGHACPLAFWYYTSMMLAFSAPVRADLIVYDCMDELANFAFAPGGGRHRLSPSRPRFRQRPPV